MSELEPHYIIIKGNTKTETFKSPEFAHTLKTAKELCAKSPNKYRIYELVCVVELAPKPVQTLFIDRFSSKKTGTKRLPATN